jgi:hypothetical protein
MEYKEYGPYTTKDGYLFICRKYKNGKRRSLYIHRLVMREKLGRDLERNEIVHHIDGDKQNNAPDNLELTNVSEHAKIHKKPARYRKVICQECSTEFSVLESRVLYNQEKKGKAGPFCGKSCTGKYSQRFCENLDRRGAGIKHGTHSAYKYGKCRCDLCRAENTRVLREYRRRKSLRSKAGENSQPEIK